MAHGWELYTPPPIGPLSPSDRERGEFRDSNMVLLYLVGEARSLLLWSWIRREALNLIGEMGVFRSLALSLSWTLSCPFTTGTTVL